MEITEIKIATKGGYNEEKYKRTVERKFEKIIMEEIPEILYLNLIEAGFSKEKAKELKDEFSEKLYSEKDKILVSTKNIMLSSRDGKDDGSIKISFNDDNAKAALGNKILKDVNSLLNSSSFGNNIVPIKDRVNILNEYLQEKGFSGLLIATPQKAPNEENIELRIKNNATIDELKIFNHFINTEVNSPLRIGLPKDLSEKTKNVIEKFNNLKYGSHEPLRDNFNLIDMDTQILTALSIITSEYKTIKDIPSLPSMAPIAKTEASLNSDIRTI